MNQKQFFFLALSFIEGASVMAAELLGAKLLAPFFGSSLYVWASVMAVTLMGLALGYFLGGMYSSGINREKKLYKILVLGAVVISLMPFTVQMCFAIFSDLSLLPSVLFSSVILLVPPVFLMGMVSPFIIGLIDGYYNNPGKSSGIVYAVSTLGGILATFLFGFYVIPSLGLVMPCMVIAITLGIVPAIMLVRNKNLMPLVLVFSIWFTFQSMALTRNTGSRIKVVDMQEGIMGQLLVVDYPCEYYYNDSTRKGEYSRWLFVNRISQTMDDPHARAEKGEERYFTYVYRIAEALDTLAGKNKKVLLLGLGGGSVAAHLTQKGYQVEVCELDDRMLDAAHNYFGLNPNIPVTIDDARHFLNVSEKKYDIIIFDTFKGEETPNHVMTKQSLAKVKTMLNPQGLVFVNSFGYWKGKRGRGMRSIYKTFTASGFSAIVVPTSADENQRNLLFVAGTDRKFVAAKNSIVPGPEMEDALVLDDDLPVFEKLNAQAAMSWRKAAIQTFVYDSLQRQLPFFH